MNALSHGEEDAVDVLMATFNGAAYVDLQIASILAQTHRHLRLLVRDDGSSDDTLERLQYWAERDSRVTLHVDGDGQLGAAANFLRLLDRSVAAFVMFSDQDDVWLANKVAACIAAHRRTETDSPVLVVCDAMTFDDRIGFVNASTHLSRPTRLQDFLFLNSGFYGCCMLLDRELVDIICARPVAYCAQHDHLVSLVALAVGRVVHVEPRLVFRRRHDSNASARSVSLAEKCVRFFRARQPIIHPSIRHGVASFASAYGPLLKTSDRAAIDDFLAFATRSRWRNALVVARRPFRLYGTRLLLLAKLCWRPLG